MASKWIMSKVRVGSILISTGNFQMSGLVGKPHEF